MAKVKKQQGKTERSGKRRRRILQIGRFETLFELAEDRRICRRSPLLYVRCYVTSSDDESAAYRQQLELLRRHGDFLELRGAFIVLLEYAANQSRTYRGFIRNAEGNPAALREIAQLLGVSPKRAREILKALSDVGLVKWVPEPTWDLSKNEQPPAPQDRQEREPGKREDGKKPRSTGRKRDSRQAKSEYQSGAELRRVAQSPFQDEMANGKREREILNGQVAKGKTKGRKTEGQKPPATPTPTPPVGQGPGSLKPPKATREGPGAPSSRETSTPSNAPPGVSHEPTILHLHQAGEAVRVGQLLPHAVDGLSAQGYAVRAPDFAEEILALLRAPFADDSRDAARERGNYQAALLDAVDAGLSRDQVERLMVKAKQDAGRIGRSRKRYYRDGGSPEAYWRFLFNKHLDARRKPPARAGPEAAAV